MLLNRQTTRRLLGRSVVVATACGALFAGAAAQAQSGGTNPVLDALPDGSWWRGPNMPSPNAYGSNSGVYSSFAFDPTRARIIKRGGGHCDYRGTEVQEFDALDTLDWSIAKPSVPNTENLPSAHFNDSQFPGAVVVLSDGSAPSNFAAAVANGQAAPIARHTTNSTTFIESTGEFFMTGKYTFSESGRGCASDSGLPYRWEPQDAWAYNVQSRQWRYLARHNIDMEWAGCTWVPQGPGVSDAQGAVFCITEQTRNLYRYDVAADSWNTVGNNVPSSGLGINLAYSDAFRSLYYYRSGSLQRYNLSNGSWQTVSTSGSVSADNWSGIAYDSINDVIGVWDASRLYLCEFSSANSCSWTTATTQNMPSGSSSGGVSSNFAFDPVNGVFWAVNGSSTLQFGAYKFREGDGTPVAQRPMPPSDVAAN